MPCRPSPMSLRQLSLNSVALNLELLCYGVVKGTKALGRLIETDQYKEYSGPFLSWPSALLQDLCTTVYTKRGGLKHLLHPVIQPQIAHFCILIHGSIHAALDLLSMRCKNLTSLEMTFSVNLAPVHYIEFFKAFPKLTVINLYGSMVDDNVFSVIGENCPHLSELNASKTWITNLGLQRLSLSRCSGVPLCQRLVTINVLETRVTIEGLSFFLHYHPNVCRIEHDETFHMFRLNRSTAEATYNLSKLTSTKETLTPDTFNLALESCPKVEVVFITSPGLTDDNLYKLMTLKSLKKLHIGNSFEPNFSFAEGVAPVLAACGQQLDKLVLEQFDEVDISFIGEKCPHLVHLALSAVTTYKPVSAEDSRLFRELTNLEVWSDEYTFICPSVLRQLLINCRQVTNVLFQGVSTLDDTLFMDILSQNRMLRLRNVVFDQCQKITLLEIPNQLRILRCWNCSGVSENDKNDIKAAIQDSNLSLYWEWYPFVAHTPEEDDD